VLGVEEPEAHLHVQVQRRLFGYLLRNEPDGTVVAAGTGTSGECRVYDWVHVAAVAAGNVHTASNTGRSHSVGLQVDGTVMATGWNGDGQCDVASWQDITRVAAGWRRTFGVGW
jgi:hypothetical protein